ncbi:MAG: hypothetical protein Q9196_007234 [Gyalolechia fulgens]
MAELARIAESAPCSDRYIVPGWRDYLRTQYGLEKLAFDTDHETVWQCVECRKGFYSLRKASVHARSAAHKPRLFKCPRCPKDFNALSGLFQHVEQSNACPEGLYRGSRVLGRLLTDIGDRMVEKDSAKLERESSSASVASAE